MVTQTEAHTYQTVTLRQLWLSLATGAVIWSLHLVVSYALTSLACEHGLLQMPWGTYTASRWVVIGLTVLAAAAVSYALFIAYRDWQHLLQTNGESEDEPGGRFRFMAFLGVTLNGIFLLGIVVSLIPSLILPLCE